MNGHGHQSHTASGGLDTKIWSMGSWSPYQRRKLQTFRVQYSNGKLIQVWLDLEYREPNRIESIAKDIGLSLRLFLSSLSAPQINGGYKNASSSIQKSLIKGKREEKWTFEQFVQIEDYVEMK